MNEIRIAVQLIGRSALRYTPVGVPVVELDLRHSGTVLEAGLPRVLEFPFPALAVGEVAGRLQAEDLGALLQLQGFLAPRRAKSTRLVIHVTAYRRDSTVGADTN